MLIYPRSSRKYYAERILMIYAGLLHLAGYVEIGCLKCR